MKATATPAASRTSPRAEPVRAQLEESCRVKQGFSAELFERIAQLAERAALALTVNTSVLTAAGNDYGFEQVFARQIDALGAPGDLLMALSTSGSSPNVLRGAEAGRRRGAFVAALTGQTGGKLAGAAS